MYPIINVECWSQRVISIAFPRIIPARQWYSMLYNRRVLIPQSHFVQQATSQKKRSAGVNKRPRTLSTNHTT